MRRPGRRARDMSLMPPPAVAPVRNTTALYKVRQALHHWRHNEFDCADSEEGIGKLIDAIDELLAHVDCSQQAWDNALGEVNFWIQMLEGVALVGGAGSFYTFIGQQKAYLVASGVLP
jgi:hypothetical protein